MKKQTFLKYLTLKLSFLLTLSPLCGPDSASDLFAALENDRTNGVPLRRDAPPPVSTAAALMLRSNNQVIDL